MIKTITYIDEKNNDYKREYSTTAIVNLNASRDIVIDFCEEYVKPFLLKSREIDGQEKEEYSHSNDELIIVRDMKATIVMNQENAINMAKLILQQYGREGD